MKYLFYSQWGESYFLADILKKKGHEVYFYISDDKYKLIGKDMGVPVVDKFYEQLNKMSKNETNIVFDDTGKGDEADNLRHKGHNVTGSTNFADRIENGRDLAQKLFKGIIDTPPTFSFTSFDEALQFLKTQKFTTRFVFKPDGADTPKDWTYVAKNIDDLDDRINFYKQNWNTSVNVHFQLQQFIEGIECDFGGWRSADGWFGDSFEWYFEDKKQQNGNLGPSVGCADAFEYFTTAEEPYFQRYLRKIGGILGEHDYSGPFSINNIYSPKEDKFYMLEVNPRFGYDSLQNEAYAILANGQDPALLLDACATGKRLPQGYFPLKTYSFNVRMYVPPYPSEDHAIDAKGDAIEIDKSVEKNFMPYDVYFSKESNRMECAGVSGMIGTMGTCGRDIDRVINGLYEKIIPKVNIADVAYRTDGAKRVKEDIKKLRQHKAIL